MANYNMFEDLKTPRDVTEYTLFRGTTDFTQLQQFDLFETGYPYLVVVSIPEFLRKMAEDDTTSETVNGVKKSTEGSISKLIKSYVHILEYEFKGLENGLDNITTSTSEINNGYQTMNVITKTNMDSNTISMRYNEKAGSIITKVHQLYLRSVKDPGTGFKTYNGLIKNEDGIYTPDQAGFDKECFSFLYMHTDNTGLLLEEAVYFVGCMPTTAELDIYNSEKGDVGFKEVTTEFTAFPIMGKAVNKRAKEILDHMNSESNKNQVKRNSWDYDYYGATDHKDKNDTSTGLYRKELTDDKMGII